MSQPLKSHIISFVLPFAVLIIIPVIILWYTEDFRGGLRPGVPYDAILVAVGIIVIAFGLFLLIWTIMLFINIGKGTLAPWAPTSKLVVSGPYKYVRNPMITGVLMALIGETVLFFSAGLLIWSALFFIINHIYFIFSEEPGLLKRFGNEYSGYKKNVPRWVPRFSPWRDRDRKE